MSFFHLDIHQLVIKQITSYLLQSSLSFNELKAILTNKAPLPSIQAKITTQLTDCKKQELADTQHRIEKKIIDTQSQEDAQDAEEEKKQNQVLDEEKKRLTHELDEIPDKILTHEKECILLVNEIRTSKQALLTDHPKKTLRHTPLHLVHSNEKNQDESDHAIASLEKKLLEQGLEISVLTQRQFAIQSKLGQINSQLRKHSNHQVERQFRDQARTVYESSQEGIFNALSIKNKKILQNSIKTQQDTLEKKLSELTQEAECIHYPVLLDQLPIILPQLQFKPPEREAITRLLKLVHSHLEYELLATSIEKNLYEKRKSINAQLNQLKKNQLKLEQLKKETPLLAETSEKMDKDNVSLQPRLDGFSQTTQRLKKIVFIFTAITALSTLPLILTLAQMIPFFIAPLLVYTLVITPPAILLFTTLCLGITTLIYSFKNTRLNALIETNQQSAEKNRNQIKRNDQELNHIECQIIPSIERQIKKDETLRDQLNKQFQDNKLLAIQHLAQAQVIEPVALAQNIHLPKSPNHIEKDNPSHLNVLDITTENSQPSLST